MPSLEKLPPQAQVKLTQLDSAAICCAGYSPTEQKMFIKFRTSQIIYAYSNVTEQMWQDFSLASSRGSWVAVNLVARPCQHAVTKYQVPYPTGFQFDLECPQTLGHAQLDRVKTKASPSYRPAWYEYREKFGAKLAYRVIGTPQGEQLHLHRALPAGSFEDRPA